MIQPQHYVSIQTGCLRREGQEVGCRLKCNRWRRIQIMIEEKTIVNPSESYDIPELLKGTTELNANVISQDIMQN
jgi:hypothetical protein